MTTAIVVACVLTVFALVATGAVLFARVITNPKTTAEEMGVRIGAIDGVQSVESGWFTSGVSVLGIDVIAEPEQSLEATQAMLSEIIKLAAPVGAQLNIEQQYRGARIFVHVRLNREATYEWKLPVEAIFNEIEAGATSAGIENQYTDEFFCSATYQLSLDPTAALQALTREQNDCQTMTRTTVEDHPRIAVLLDRGQASIPAETVTPLLPYLKELTLRPPSTGCDSVELSGLQIADDINLSTPGIAELVGLLEALRDSAGPDRQCLLLTWPGVQRSPSIVFQNGVTTVNGAETNETEPETAAIEKLISLMS